MDNREVLSRVIFQYSRSAREKIDSIKDKLDDLFYGKYEKTIFLKNEIIIKEESINDKVYFIDTGKVILTRTDLSNREFCNGYILPGEFFGFASSYTQKPSVATYKALSNCSIYVMSFSDIKNEMEANQELRIMIEKIMVESIGNFTIRQGNLILGDCRTAFVNFIVEHIRENGKLDENHDLIVSLDINLAEVAIILNMTRETLSRIVSEMKRDGIIDTRRRYIKIIDLERFVS